MLRLYRNGNAAFLISCSDCNYALHSLIFFVPIFLPFNTGVAYAASEYTVTLVLQPSYSSKDQLGYYLTK